MWPGDHRSKDQAGRYVPHWTLDENSARSMRMAIFIIISLSTYSLCCPWTEWPTHLVWQDIWSPYLEPVQGRMCPWPWNHFNELSTIIPRGFQYKWKFFWMAYSFIIRFFERQKFILILARVIQLRRKVWKKKKKLSSKKTQPLVTFSPGIPKEKWIVCSLRLQGG